MYYVNYITHMYDCIIATARVEAIVWGARRGGWEGVLLLSQHL